MRLSYDSDGAPIVLRRRYLSTKTFDHSEGLSACFRQVKAESHCHYLHGYALAFAITFAADTLDERGWVVDFGGLKTFKAKLKDTFDHKTLVAEDDPFLESFKKAHAEGWIDLKIVKATGCEAFAKLVSDMAEDWLRENGYMPRCWVHSVECKEHGANSALFVNELLIHNDEIPLLTSVLAD